jgi:ubiquinone/menaquinone biosynthesis C-methylase UbiE
VHGLNKSEANRMTRANQKTSAGENNLRKGGFYAEEALFDSLATEYDDWFDGEGKLIFANEVRAFRETLAFLPEPWLEIGVGSGRFAQALGIASGVDPSIKLLEMAGKRGITVRLGRGEQQIFGAASFGTVFLIVTLCFLDSVHSVLKEVYRILIADGKIVVGLVLKESPWGKFYEEKKMQGHRFYKYAHFYRYDEVVTFLEQSGFSIEKVISTLFQKPGKVDRMELPRTGFSPDAGFVIIVAGKKAGERALVG